VPDEGQIILEGKAHSHLTPAASQRFGVQIIYQDLSLFPNLTVAENIAFRHHVETPVRVANRQVMRKQAQAVMDRLKVSLPLDELVGTLPIATRQLVAICRALAAEARLVVMDEPTASLSHQEVEGLLAVVHELKRQNIANLFVSHRLDEVMDIAERVTVMRDGRNFGTYPVSELDRRRLGELITGQVFESSVKAPFSSKDAPALEVRGLTCTGQYTDINFELRPGEILGLTGRMGSGRTELALSLFGMNPPDSGEIRVKGKPVHFHNNRDAIRQGIAYVSEDRLSLRVGNAANNRGQHRRIGAGQVDGPRLASSMARAALKPSSAGFSRSCVSETKTAERPVQQLSGGNQQRVVLAKWLATDPRVLILDSPTVGR
jgi:simple sugar transport system ATP-binding protein